MTSSEVKSLIIPIIILVIIILISTVYFHFVEGWRYLDAAYFTIVTISTVGYGDFTPRTDLGKVGVFFLIFAGISTALYVITHLGSIREKTIDPHVQRRLQILRNLTALQTGKVDKSQMKKIKEKIESRSDSKKDDSKDDSNRGFGSL